jgi:hypothetical protein
LTRNLSDWFSVEATIETVRRRRTRLRTTPAGEQFDNRVNALKPPKSAPADLMPRDSDHVNAARAKAEKERQRESFFLDTMFLSTAATAEILDELRGKNLYLHGGIFDLPRIKRHFGVDLLDEEIRDTMILSRLARACRGQGWSELGRSMNHEPTNVLPALREMHYRDPEVLELDELVLQGMLKDEGYLGYLDYWAPMSSIGAALDSLAIQRGLDYLGADVEVGEGF